MQPHTLTLTQNLTLAQNLTLTQNLSFTQNLGLTQNLTLTQNSTLTQIYFADKGFIIKTLFLRVFLVCLQTSEHEAWTMAPQCTCGCTLTDSEGVIMTSSKCTSSSIWRISAAQGRVVRLEFRVFRLNGENKATWVLIHEGDRSSPLLKTVGGALPVATTTTQNEMIIEYMGPTDRMKNEYGQEEDEGFVAKYSTFGIFMRLNDNIQRPAIWPAK